MTSPTRRIFLQATSTAAAPLSLASYVHHAGAADAKKALSVALIGCGGRGSYLAGVFQSNPGVSLSWVCDVDTGRLKRGQKLAREKVKTSDDIRKVLSDDTLDAVIVATPDHWHSPAARINLAKKRSSIALISALDRLPPPEGESDTKAAPNTVINIQIKE